MNKDEYKLNKKLIELEGVNKLKCLEYIRETERLKHEWEKERMRIKSAEIKRHQIAKENMRFMRKRT